MTRILIVLTAWAALAAAQQSAPDPKAFSKGLDRAKRYVETSRWEKARKTLDRTLAAHFDQGYARARRAEIVELARTCDFRAQHPPPDPKRLVSGKLLSYSRSSGKLKIRYGRDEMDDWSRGETRVHPARFAGPYSIKIKGSSYPAGNGATILAGMSDDGGFVVRFGREQINEGMRGTWVPSQICRIHDDSLEERDSKEMSPCKSGKPYRVQVKVTSSSIIAAYNGRQIMSTGKPRKLWGYVGFVAAMGFDEIEIEGKAEPAWLQGRANTLDEAQRAEFAKRWKPEQRLPRWLFVEPKATVAKADEDERKWPGEVLELHRPVLDQAEFLLEMERYKHGLAYVRKRSPKELSPAARHWLLARYHHAMESYPEALEACRATAARDSDFLPARVLEVELLRHLGRRDEARALLDELVEKFPDSSVFHADLAEALLADGRYEESKALVDRLLARGVTSKEVESLNATLVKALQGPTWSRRFEFTSENYRVISDIDKRTCRQAAQLLEESYVAYTNRLERVTDLAQRRFVVYLFSGESGYKAYCRDLWGVSPSHTAGLYAPPLKQLLIWNLPDRDSMMETVRHEGFHQYLDRLMDDPPLWFNEGLATYYQTARRVGARWHLGDPPEDYLAIVRRYPPKLKELFALDRRKFLERAGLHYPQSWSVIHLLRHGRPEHRKLFDALWKAFKEDSDYQAALDRVLAGVDLDRLQRDLDGHIASLD